LRGRGVGSGSGRGGLFGRGGMLVEERVVSALGMPKHGPPANGGMLRFAQHDKRQTGHEHAHPTRGRSKLLPNGNGGGLAGLVGGAEGGGDLVAGVGEEGEEEVALVRGVGVEEGGAPDDAALFAGDIDGEGEAGGKAALAAVGAGEELEDVHGGQSLAAFVGGGDVGAAGPGVVDEGGEVVEDGARVVEVIHLGAGDAAGVEGDDAIVFVEGEGGDGVVVDGAVDDGV